MIKRIMMRILFIGVPISVVVWLVFWLVLQVYITPFDTYYFDGYMERKINNTTISTSICLRKEYLQLMQKIIYNFMLMMMRITRI